MIVTIRFRRGSATQWTTANPVLKSGEPGLDTTVQQIKIGDGFTAWNDLGWLGGGGDAAAVESVNGQTGAVVLTAATVGARAADWVPAWTDVTGKPTTFAPGVHSHVSTEITDATATGRSLLTAANAGAARVAIGAMPDSYAPSWESVTNKPATFTPATHGHTTAQVTDTTVTGRALMTATDASTARATIGALADSYVPSWTNITGKPSTFTPSAHGHVIADLSDSTAFGRSLMSAADAAAARTALGVEATTAPTWESITGKPTTFTPTAHSHTVANLSDATAFGRTIIQVADATAARTLIGAGTSNLAIGTTGSTAKAGNYVPTWTEVTSKPTTFTPATHSHAIADVTGLQAELDALDPVTVATIPAGSTLTVHKSGGTWPARPTSRTDVIVQWVGADPSPTIVSSGTGGMLDNVDLRMVTP